MRFNLFVVSLASLGLLAGVSLHASESSTADLAALEKAVAGAQRS